MSGPSFSPLGNGDPPSTSCAIEFLQALFDPSDLVLFRPIETWVQAGRKQSRVDYKQTAYRTAGDPNLRSYLEQLFTASADDHLNLFFGACPRFGGDGKYDLAWQVRAVRALWTDIDDVKIEEARQRLAQSRLPEPSIIVASGNGAHVYWLLEPVEQITDASDPSPVLTEWDETPSGKKRPRKYIVEDDERIYLDAQRHVSRLSPEAIRLQEILAGIADRLGGDHTTDLARLLRLPGSMNRKNGRNGDPPRPTKLVSCQPSRRYPIEAFEGFRLESPNKKRAAQIASMPLPTPRKLSATKCDKLSELVAKSGIAPPGQRSEADFAVCCYAIRSGASKGDVWREVEGVGKFAELGRRYFDVTWSKAEQEVRGSLFEQLTQSKPTVRGAPLPYPADSEGRPVIEVDASQTPVGDTLHETTDHLLATRRCYLRADQLVVIRDDEVSSILSSPELAGLLNEHVEFYFVGEGSGQFKPFPPSYANTWLNHRGERDRFPKIELFTRNPVFTEDWRLVAPGYDQKSKIYYAGPSINPRSTTTCLDRLLSDFCFKAPGDRTNYLGMLLTTVLMPRFIGSKPAVLFNGNQPQLGKSVLAQIIAILRDGHSAETASYNSNDEEFEKRLGSIVRRGVTTIIIDNAKGKNRHPRIESACLERSITDPVLSFRLLGQSQEIRAENSHIFCITANTPDVSRDLVTRSCVVNLHYEGDPDRRQFTIKNPEGYALEHREELLGELIGLVERWKQAGMPMADAHSRFNKRGWGTIVGGILHEAGEPDFLANAQEAASVLDETRREFTELVSVLADHPQGVWTAAELVEECSKQGLLVTDLGEGSPRSLSTKMGTLVGRFVGERFEIDAERSAQFVRQDGRKGKLYRVAITTKVPNL